MKILVSILFSFIFSNVYSQNIDSLDCRPNIDVKAIICPNNFDSILNKLCPFCDHCMATGIIASDRSYSIISFKIRGEKLCNENHTELEAQNTGAAWNEAHLVINSACAGSILKFTCVKAKDKNGKIHILQPLTIQL
jgi:hypothetical protein